MGEKICNCHHVLVSKSWEKAALLKMKEAARKEADFDSEYGHLDKNGIPCITVVADGCWSKRSYRSICISAERNNETPKTHACFRNLTGSSTRMESTILVKESKNSLSMYGIEYIKLIADGDSSTYKGIVMAKLTVEKIKCRNKLEALSTERRFPIKVRSLLTASILRLRKGATSAIKYGKEMTYWFTIRKQERFDYQPEKDDHYGRRRIREKKESVPRGDEVPSFSI
ncbi:hypothetical protein ILUMI_24668 [Ignelater luminosus]|uniref:Mutator-like transposase domain-containing protein n=1 Tax=Ignelater luminosus TaxID=2038154 RepID=A0A8K0C9T4_IGNLU|nr:hypothetical protein ILUMI_24668 [Ignelater luminosus]